MGAWPEHDHAAAWTTTDYLLANVIDAIQELTWVTIAINSKHKPERPKPVYRPGGGQTSARPKTDWMDLARSLGAVNMGIRNGNGHG